jgi:hypothetical protein
MAGQQCRSCGQDILWGKVSRTGKAMPLDPEPKSPDEKGVMVAVPRGMTTWLYTLDEISGKYAEQRGTSVQTARSLVVDQFEGFVSHFATCPNASKHRRPK